MGDFNINLLDYASHTPTCDFAIALLLAFIIQLEFLNIKHQSLITLILMLTMLILHVGIY